MNISRNPQPIKACCVAFSPPNSQITKQRKSKKPLKTELLTKGEPFPIFGGSSELFCTRVGIPTGSKACCNARLLITFANIPIHSLMGRSIPIELRDAPAKKNLR